MKMHEPLFCATCHHHLNAHMRRSPKTGGWITGKCHACGCKYFDTVLRADPVITPSEDGEAPE